MSFRFRPTVARPYSSRQRTETARAIGLPPLLFAGPCRHDVVYADAKPNSGRSMSSQRTRPADGAGQGLVRRKGVREKTAIPFWFSAGCVASTCGHLLSFIAAHSPTPGLARNSVTAITSGRRWRFLQRCAPGGCRRPAECFRQGVPRIPKRWDRRHAKVAGILEADEDSVEQVVDAGRQQQSILPIEPLVVRQIPSISITTLLD